MTIPYGNMRDIPHVAISQKTNLLYVRIRVIKRPKKKGASLNILFRGDTKKKNVEMHIINTDIFFF